MISCKSLPPVQTERVLPDCLVRCLSGEASVHLWQEEIEAPQMGHDVPIWPKIASQLGGAAGRMSPSSQPSRLTHAFRPDTPASDTGQPSTLHVRLAEPAF